MWHTRFGRAEPSVFLAFNCIRSIFYSGLMRLPRMSGCISQVTPGINSCARFPPCTFRAIWAIRESPNLLMVV